MPPPPPSLGLDAFYEKYLVTDCLPIVSSGKVPDGALTQARDVIAEMIVNRPDLCNTIADLGHKIAILADDEVITEIPELPNMYELWPDIDHDRRRGLTAFGDTRTTIIEAANVLCTEHDSLPTEDIIVHEVAHTVLNYGVGSQTGGTSFIHCVDDAYAVAMETGLWEGTYASTNKGEYWAEGVQSWFGLNGPPGSLQNNINTRGELDDYDPTLSRLIEEVFGDANVTSSCHMTEDINRFRIKGRVIGPDDQPLEGIGLSAWQGQAENSGSGRTGSNGTFVLWVPAGSFTLDVYADFDAGCTFVDWLGPGGFTASLEEAIRVEVNGADVKGIVIKLPRQLDQLPFIEHCS